MHHKINGKLFDNCIADVIKKQKEKNKHTCIDRFNISLWQQMWGRTSCGFGGIGCAAMTIAYTIIIQASPRSEIYIYHDSTFAYFIEHPNELFWDEVNSKRLTGQTGDWKSYEK